MRTRNKRWARPFLEANASWIYKPTDSIQKIFLENEHIAFEIGVGKGSFFAAMADQNRQYSWLGIEKQPSILAIAARKIELVSPPLNAHLLDGDLQEFFEQIPAKRIERIYLNFSDPWPKARHEKRRLTSPAFLNYYDQWLTDDGMILMKTDNVGLYQYTLETVANDKRFSIVSQTDNYQGVEGDVATEYELYFRSLGQPIHRIIIKRSTL